MRNGCRLDGSAGQPFKVLGKHKAAIEAPRQVDSGRYQGKWFLLRDAAEFYALAVAMTSEDLAHVRDRFRTANAVALFDGFQVAVEHVLAFEFPQHRPEQEHAAWAAQTLNRLAWPELHRAVYAARAVTDHAARLARHREVRRRHLAALRQPRQRGDFFAQYIMNLRGFQ